MLLLPYTYDEIDKGLHIKIGQGSKVPQEMSKLWSRKGHCVICASPSCGRGP